MRLAGHVGSRSRMRSNGLPIGIAGIYMASTLARCAKNRSSAICKLSTATNAGSGRGSGKAGKSEIRIAAALPAEKPNAGIACGIGGIGHLRDEFIVEINRNDIADRRRF